MSSNRDVIFATIGYNNDGQKDPTRKSRFRNNQGVLDSRSPNYNMNGYEHGNKIHFVGEGPDWGFQSIEHAIEQAERFFRALKQNQIDNVIIAGTVTDRASSGFLAYFLPDEQRPESDKQIIAALEGLGIKINVTPIKVGTDNLNKYKMNLTIDGEPYSFIANHISNFKDFSTTTFNDEEIVELLKIHNDSKNLMIHCGAGLGRSGVIEFAYALLDNKKLANSPLDMKMVCETLENLRKKRPGLVQKSEQFQMGIELAFQMYLRSHNRLIDRGAISQMIEQGMRLHLHPPLQFEDPLKSVSMDVFVPSNPQEIFKANLESYIDRIQANKTEKVMDDKANEKYSTGFSFFPKWRSKNRKANYNLAKKLLSQLDEGKSLEDVISKTNIEKLRKKDKYHLSFTAIFSTSELYDILEAARHPEKNIKIHTKDHSKKTR